LFYFGVITNQSVGHINPAVTWATLITNKISVLRALTFIVFQLLGAIIGSALLKSILPPALQFSMGCHGLNPKLTPSQGFGAEVIFTAIFLFVVFATAISPFAGKFAPLSGGNNEYP
jgi:glycerol uptake facilitator-like aquaporin